MCVLCLGTRSFHSHSYHTESKLVSKLAASIGSSVTYDVLLEFVPIQTSKAGQIPLFGDVGLRNKDPVTS